MGWCSGNARAMKCRPAGGRVSTDISVYFFSVLKTEKKHGAERVRVQPKAETDVTLEKEDPLFDLVSRLSQEVGDG